MAIDDGRLYVVDYYGDSIVHIFDIASAQEIGMGLSRGNGPGEVLAPVRLFFDNDSVYVYSRPTMSLNSGVKDNLNLTRGTRQLPTKTSNLFLLDNGLFITTDMPLGTDGNTSSYRMSVTSHNGEALQEFGRFPRLTEKEKNAGDDVLANFHQLINVFSTDDNTVIALTRQVWSKYRLTDGRYELVSEKILVPYDYDYVEGSANSSARTNLKEGYSRGFSDAVMYKDKIVASYRESVKKDDDRIKFNVYDFEGNLIEQLDPDEPVQAPFCITPDGRIITMGLLDDGPSVIMISKESVL